MIIVLVLKWATGRPGGRRVKTVGHGCAPVGQGGTPGLVGK